MNGVIGYILLKNNLIKQASGETKVVQETAEAVQKSKNKILDKLVKVTQVTSGTMSTIGAGVMTYAGLQRLKENKRIAQNQQELKEMQLRLLERQAALKGDDSVIPHQSVPLPQNAYPEAEFKIAAEKSPKDEFDNFLDSILGPTEENNEIEESLKPAADPKKVTKQLDTNKRTSQPNLKQQEQVIKKASELDRESIITDVLEKKATLQCLPISEITKEYKKMSELSDEELLKEAERWNEALLNNELNVAEPYNVGVDGEKTSAQLMNQLIDLIKTEVY